jgi:hypothetical protein
MSGAQCRKYAAKRAVPDSAVLPVRNSARVRAKRRIVRSAERVATADRRTSRHGFEFGSPSSARRTGAFGPVPPGQCSRASAAGPVQQFQCSGARASDQRSRAGCFRRSPGPLNRAQSRAPHHDAQSRGGRERRSTRSVTSSRFACHGLRRGRDEHGTPGDRILPERPDLARRRLSPAKLRIARQTFFHVRCAPRTNCVRELLFTAYGQARHRNRTVVRSRPRITSAASAARLRCRGSRARPPTVPAANSNAARNRPARGRTARRDRRR